MKICDICGRDEFHESRNLEWSAIEITLTHDGLWICQDCRKNYHGNPEEIITEEEIDNALLPLIGQSAGAICRTLEIPYQPPFQSILEAASRIAYNEDKYMSAWTFLTQWLDGTTVWLSEDQSSRAVVNPNGGILLFKVD